MAGKTARHHRISQGEHIDATVGPLAYRIEGHIDRCLGFAPGLNPGDAPGFKLGDDALSDFLVEVRPPGRTIGMLRAISNLRNGWRQASLAALLLLALPRSAGPALLKG